MIQESVIGGEAGKRRWWGGRVSPQRAILLVVTTVIALIVGNFFGIYGILPGATLIGLAWLATIETDNSTILTRMQRRLFWRRRDHEGSRIYVPFDQEEWDELTTEYAAAKERKDRAKVFVRLRAMRQNADGAIGMSWLQKGFGKPGIAMHHEPNEESYLSVVFSTSGQVRGMQSDQVIDALTSGFEGILSENASGTSLIERIQMVNRIVPGDSTRHAVWFQKHLDPQMRGTRLLASYEELVEGMHRNEPHQRHMIVASWPLSSRFHDRARRRGNDLTGWRRLMAVEIERFRGQLVSAGFGDVKIMTARGVAAALRHMQNPDFALDRVADADPESMWLPSLDEWSYTAYVGAPYGPEKELTTWMTRTATVRSKALETSMRNAFWSLPLLTGVSVQVVRTVSFHIELVPQQEALDLARADVTNDISEQLGDERSGKLVDETTETALQAAKRRRADLVPGARYQGANWVGYITIASRNLDDLGDAIEAITDAASKTGIRKLEWSDTAHSIANCYTMPLGRGIKPRTRGAAARLEGAVAGKKAKEAFL
ncbi:hypothetical protein C5C31_13825 [Rathayibacter rathayi]|uniref:PrgI family protein n=1 Tax=Rathayibacter rathayi TaxID=33887 RepID=A0ABX5AAY3_RATRA|nr:SCO6880 family protein [Rathayibacter rathayi]MWV76009.1 hypothetical protein [Rathayibacter rathayi NCPPB 2980 = VKM Ac-1601]PPF23034.1 hypothetical protein C5C34_10295 [Rathayibacter rathayi]PPF42642.1 hypothetical protein C5C08_14775 [Rathayibacter rathayi]PPF75287.1 hypothetical protein C5C14_14520 [Rathayibacter rathayi]PPG09854.1 hypothetical protein C5C11_14900 [Rathayibacter rathayi]